MAASAAEITLDDPVIKHMRADVSRLHVGETVGEALAALRQSPPAGGANRLLLRRR